MSTKRVEEMILAVCRKHAEVHRCAAPPLAAAAAAAACLLARACMPRSAACVFFFCLPSTPHPHLRHRHARACLQGVQDTVLEAELPDVPVDQRALAINALLTALKLQILVNPADPSSHIYKAATTGDATRCAAAGRGAVRGAGCQPPPPLLHCCRQGPACWRQLSLAACRSCAGSRG